MDLSPTRIHVRHTSSTARSDGGPVEGLGALGGGAPSSSSTRYELPPLALALAATAGGAVPWPDASHEPARLEPASAEMPRRSDATRLSLRRSRPPEDRPPVADFGGVGGAPPSVGRADGVARDAVETVVCARERASSSRTIV